MLTEKKEKFIRKNKEKLSKIVGSNYYAVKNEHKDFLKSAQKELGYQPSTWLGDVFISLQKSYKIVFEQE